MEAIDFETGNNTRVCSVRLLPAIASYHYHSVKFVVSSSDLALSRVKAFAKGLGCQDSKARSQIFDEGTGRLQGSDLVSAFRVTTKTQSTLQEGGLHSAE